jgi:hypothetical protein
MVKCRLGDALPGRHPNNLSAASVLPPEEEVPQRRFHGVHGGVVSPSTKFRNVVLFTLPGHWAITDTRLWLSSRLVVGSVVKYT